MEVREIMTTEVAACAPDTTLAIAAAMMWDTDCGALPVVDGNNKVVGMVTDRDICMAVTMRGASPSQLRVSELESGGIFYCKPEDDLKNALEVMRVQKIRRLPIVNDEDELQGMLSINDMVLHAVEGRRRKGKLAANDVFGTLKSISEHWHPGAPDDPNEKSIVKRNTTT
jgi:CBS domain-containing protein